MAVRAFDNTKEINTMTDTPIAHAAAVGVQKPISRVPELFNQQETLLNALAGELDRLEEAIQPALGPEPDKTPGTIMEDGQFFGQSAVARSIQDSNDRLEITVSRLVQLRQRIEL